MRHEPPERPHLGDPLLGDARTQAPTHDASRPSAQRELFANPIRRFGPLSRLLFSVTAVLGVTVFIGQSGASTTDNIADGTPAIATSSNADSGPANVAPSKRVLVSDPANAAIVREVAGGLVLVESFVPNGANGHTYEPVPSDAIKAAQADMYIENGMDLNLAVTNFVRANMRSGTPEIRLADAIPSSDVISTDSAEDIASHGHAHSFNAHFWTDPNYVILYIQSISQALSNVDPANSSQYQQNAAAFIQRLQTLDQTFRSAIASIPEQNRKLIVYHDSWSYFGRRYGIPVIGAIQPVSFSEPSANEIRRIIAQVRKEQVPAFFGSEVFPSDVLQTVAAETGSQYFSDLSDDEIPGTPGSPEHSYEGMMIRNVRLITSALGGNPSVLDSITLEASPQ